MQSNPLQQRIELICEKWEETKKQQNARIVRILCQEDEVDMVDTFYTYMIGADTPILDIAFHFDSACTDIKTFSGKLLKELEEIIHIWNVSEKDDRIDYVPVTWSADYLLRDDQNPAALFVHNFNKLAEQLDLRKNLFAVAILKGTVTDGKLASWLEYAIQAPINPKAKFLISDTISKPFFREIAISFPGIVAIIPLNLNMPKALEQIAAMGDPKDPATSYRQVFMKMMNAMGEGSETEAEKRGLECIDIAHANLSKDPFWIMQVVVVYIALGNDKIRYKKKKETLGYANKAVDTAIASKAYFDDNTSSVLMAQALMFRGTVLFIQDNFSEAYPDFVITFEIYKKQNNISLAIEACRMAGKSALNASQKSNGIKILAEGARLGRKFDLSVARASTYAGILEVLLQTQHESIIPMEEISDIANNIYGPDWLNLINNWKKAPDRDVLKQQELEAAEK